MRSNLNYESIVVPLPCTEQLHLTRFYKDKKKLLNPVFMLHSTVQDGRTFYTEDGHGLAYFLAQLGYDVFIADLRGKGKSWPQINNQSDFGHHQAINEEIPALLHEVISRRGHIPQIWLGHGWGGVLLCSVYARYGSAFCPVSKMIHFGVRRKIVANTLTQAFCLDLIWRRLGFFLVKTLGYLPAKALALGKANESAQNYHDYLLWSQADQWIDPADGFDYGKAAREQLWPASFYFAAKGDQVFGNIDDVRAFVGELGEHDGRIIVLGSESGNSHNYGHLSMLNSKDAERDHFPELIDWLE